MEPTAVQHEVFAAGAGAELSVTTTSLEQKSTLPRDHRKYTPHVCACARFCACAFRVSVYKNQSKVQTNWKKCFKQITTRVELEL